MTPSSWPRPPAQAALLTSLLCGLVVAGLPGPARADLASHFGMNARSLGMAGAYSAVSDDLASLYYNPAGLVQLKGLSVSTGLLYGTSLLAEDGRRLAMDDETSFYLHVGIPLSGKLKDHLALGVTLNMPWGKHVHGSLFKKDEPYFVAYDSSVQLMQFRAGAAFRIPYRPLAFLTFGAAIQVLGSVSGAVTMYVPLQDSTDGQASDPDSRMEAWIDLEVPTSVFYTAGAMASLGENLRLGLAYRSEQSIQMILPVSITARIAASETFHITIPVTGEARFNPKFYPQQVSLGASYRLGRWLFAADLTWVDYSAYQIPYAQVTLDIDKLKKDPGLKILVGDDSQILEPFIPDVQWNDMLVPRFGVEVAPLPWLTLRAGYWFERSPLRSADIPVYDCDKHGFALGARASLLKPWGIIPGWLHVDLGLEDIWYVERRILGSEVGGQVLGIIAGLEVVFL